MTDLLLPASFQRTIEAGESIHLDLNSPSLKDDNGASVQQASPYKNLSVVNQGSSINLNLNGNFSGQSIPNGVIWDRKDADINSITIKNTGSNSTTINLSLDNNETELSVLKDIKNILKGAK
ncbi:MAG: hypothetical protein ACOC1P_00605 [Minisyncoccales bacterium]